MTSSRSHSNASDLQARSACLAAAIVATLLGAASAYAAPPPDAGQTTKQLQPTPPLPQDSAPLQLQAPIAAPPLPGGPQFTLTKIHLTSTAFDAGQLLDLVVDAYGQRLDLAGLNALAERITAYYRSHGYPFAVALIPAQTLRGGEVTIEIIEGRYGRVTASGDSSSATAAWLTDLEPGAPITQAPLERSLRVLGNLPGVTMNPVMQPGRATGEGDLDVSLQSQRFGGAVSLDNHGNRYTGQELASASAWANGLLTFGDRLMLDASITTETLWHGGVNYELPLGTDGLRAHAGYAHTHYELGEEFARLGANGSARIASTGLSYPMLLRARGSVAATFDYEHKWLHDAQDAVGTAVDKSSDNVRAGLGFDWRDALLGGGVSWGSLSWTHGRLDLDDALTASDARTARTRGGFEILALDLARVQRVGGPLSLYTRLVAQWANRNLDSSERFGLGGTQGIRAYPSGEGYGDEGALLQTEVRYNVGALTPYGFYDAGRVRINAEPWTSGNNHRNLGGAGAGLRWKNKQLSADVSVAWRTRGGAPEADTHDPKPRVWAGLQSRF
jgi:hemolysin activation/secretion protein